MISFSIVEENEVDHSKVLFKYEGSFNRMWGKLVVNQEIYYIGWRSDLIEPLLIESNGVICIGVDEHYALLTPGKTLTGKSYSPLLNGSANENVIALIFEIEVHVISLATLEIKEFGLPDIAESYTLEENSIELKCLDGKEYRFEW
jgi:hypothetical protein